VFAEREHADLRAGQIAHWIKTKHEPLLPQGVGWDTGRRSAFPDRPLLARPDSRHPLSQPANLQVLATRLLVVVIDALALVVGAGKLVGAALAGPGWALWASSAGACCGASPPARRRSP
jgi:hypothetical protein